MKLKFERFEGLSCFTVRGDVKASELKILQVGLELLVKDLDTTLVVNFSLATVSEAIVAPLLAIKKSLSPPDKIKIHWISPIKILGDFPALPPFTSRLTGMKHRQIGERINLDDEIYALNEKLIHLTAQVAALSGDDNKAQAMILQNRILKEQERILRESTHFQRERMKLQSAVPSLNEELPQKLATVRTEVLRIFGKDLDV